MGKRLASPPAVGDDGDRALVGTLYLSGHGKGIYIVNTLSTALAMVRVPQLLVPLAM